MRREFMMGMLGLMGLSVVRRTVHKILSILVFKRSFFYIYLEISRD